MTRPETTTFLSNLLEDSLRAVGTQYATEVVIDWGTKDIKRIDFVAFKPKNSMSIAGIEKGEVTCYEVKSCVADLRSGCGLNFIGDKNYLITTMETYKAAQRTHISKLPPGTGIRVATPTGADIYAEFSTPTALPEDGEIRGWDLRTVIPAHTAHRKKSLLEILYCMLRRR